MIENKKGNEQHWMLLVLMLKNIAKEKGVTQYQIAEAIGMQRSNISRVFTLKYTPTIKTLNLIAQAIDSRITIIDNSVDMNLITSLAEKELEEFKSKSNE